MKIATLKTSNSIREELIAHLVESILFDYINISEEMTLLANEEFYLRTTSDQLNVIIIRSVGAFLVIDLVGGGGAAGLFRMTWGSEGAFVKKTVKLLQEFCQVQGETIELMADT